MKQSQTQSQIQIPPFVHLHVHSVYSKFDGTCSIPGLFMECERLGMPGFALTDHGTTSGVRELFQVAKDHPAVKPIAGCEIYQGRYHLILLAKNLTGYRNLRTIVDIGWKNGFQKGRPRVSRETIAEHSEGLICTSACIGGEVAQAILADDLDGARKAIAWYKKVFGEDFYLEVELQSNIVEKRIYPKQQIVAKWAFILGHEMKVKVIAANDVHFLTEDDAESHDLMLCEKTHSDPSDPERFRYTGQEWFKSAEEMYYDFCFHPEAMENTMEIFDKVERYEI